jgi:hypothetical protein
MAGAAALALFASAPVSAAESSQEDTETPAPESVRPASATLAAATIGTVYTPVDFERFSSRNALEMLNQIPGFSIRGDNNDRGLGQANANVLVNGKRISSKSDDVFDQLRRITPDRVERIEIVDGATLDIAGLYGQVANVITKSGSVSGRFEYRATWRPKYANPSYGGGEISVAGSSDNLEWNLAYTHNVGRGGAGGIGAIEDGLGDLVENRDILIQFNGEFPRLAGNLKWESTGGTTVNFNANYGRRYNDLVIDKNRLDGSVVDLLREFRNKGRGYSYEIGGDVEFPLGPGSFKLIGLERFERSDNQQDYFVTPVGEDPISGSRFTTDADSGERIARAEYRWDMLGGNWQLDAEAAYNRLEQESGLFGLDMGELVEIPLPQGSGGVTEDRYEMILTHGRPLADNLSLQLGMGGEYSKLSQTGPGGLTRTFWRPKGSMTLAWTPEQGRDISLKVARRVGQLSFGDFLARVFLEQNNQNVGNNELVPTQTWEIDFEFKEDIGKWGSLRLFANARLYDDFIDIIPLPGGGESRGNIDTARSYRVGLSGTINLDPIGIKGAKIDLNGWLDESSIEDPLTGLDRPFSYRTDRHVDISWRHDIPNSDWAYGFGMEYNHALPGYRLNEVGWDYEGPTYTWAFVEHKDVFGLTVNLNVFNVTDGRAIFDRYLYDGPRDSSPLLSREVHSLSVQPIFRIQVKGSF